MFIKPPQLNSPELSVSVIPSSNAAEDVSSLNVDPGSYVSDIALFLHICCNAVDLSPEDNLSQTNSKSSSFILYGLFKS